LIFSRATTAFALLPLPAGNPARLLDAMHEQMLRVE
jgi:hypothetical protein